MQTYNFYYIGNSHLKEFVKLNNINDNNQILIQIFTSKNDEKFIRNLLQEFKLILPSATLIGATTDGEICEGKVTTNQTVISITQFKNTLLKLAFVENTQESHLAGTKIAQALTHNDAKLFITFSDGLYCDGEQYLKGINAINKSVQVAGGMAGDSATFESTYIFCNDTVLNCGAVGVSLINADLQIYTDNSFNWTSIGKEMLITKVENNRVYTIDNHTAYEIYKKYLGNDTARELPNIGIEYPLIIDRNGQKIARAVLQKHEDGSLSFAGDFQVGDLVTFGYGDAESILHKAQDSITKLQDKAVESIFIYSCMARRRFMPNLIEAETDPFNSISKNAGFFTYGEFFTTKHGCELLNQTMTFVALSETTKITPKKNITTSDLYLNAYQKSIRALSHLLNITTEELHQENKNLTKFANELSAREESLTLAQEIGHFGSWEIDLQKRTSKWSKESYHIYKLDPNESAPNLDEFVSWIIEEDRQKAYQKLQELHSGKIVKTDVRIKRKDEVIIHVLINGKMVFDALGNPSKIIGTTLNISELVALKEKNSELAYIVENSSTEIYIVQNDTFNYLYVNDMALKTLGYTRDEMMNMDIFDINKTITMQQVQSLQAAMLRDKKTSTRSVHTRKDGTTYPIQSYIQETQFNNQQAAIIFDIDITELIDSEIKQQEQAITLQYQADHDYLTNLPNRVLFNTVLTQYIDRAKNEETEFALLFIDLDNFKEINDTLGHSIGDKVLKRISYKLTTILFEDEFVARIGGDEFMVIANVYKTDKKVAVLAQKLLTSIKSKMIINNHELYLSASIGISFFPHDTSIQENLIKYADSAMYKAKELGKNKYEYYSQELTQKTLEKVAMQNSFHTAIKNNEFIVYYQPQINAVENTISGMEALVRWNHPTLGFISPDRFIPLAEETGFIVELDSYVMKQGMQDFTSWYALGLCPGKLALNLSIKHLNSTHLIDTIKKYIAQTHFELHWLELEITESQMMKDPLGSIKKLNLLSDMGIEIAIDDFGTGYSSLAYLKRLPVDKLKIDKSFVNDLPHDEEDAAISNAIISLSQSLNLKIIAEGVETEEQKDFLLANGCNDIQGYYYSKPLSYADASTFLSNI